MPNDTAPLTLKGALQELGRARDVARVRLHLLSKNARERTDELATMAFEHGAGQGIDKAAARALVKAGEVAREVQGFVSRHSPVRGPLKATVATVMTADVKTCAPGDSLHRAAQVMWDADCGAVPVVAAGGKLLGILTDRDICMASFTQSRPLSSIQVDSVMSQVLHTCSTNDPLQRVIELMSSKQVRRVPVVRENDLLIGIVALSDIARYLRARSGKNVNAYAKLGLTLSAVSARRGNGLSVRAAE